LTFTLSPLILSLTKPKHLENFPLRSLFSLFFIENLVFFPFERLFLFSLLQGNIDLTKQNFFPSRTLSCHWNWVFLLRFGLNSWVHTRRLGRPFPFEINYREKQLLSISLLSSWSFFLVPSWVPFSPSRLFRK